MAKTDLFEEMLASYPAEKRELAREVYHRFADGDSSNFFTQLLIVLDVYAYYIEHIPARMITANADSLASVQEMREEIGLLAKAIESRDVSISNHAEKTDELCKITIAKCNETVSCIELMLKNLGSQVDTNAIVQGIKNTVETNLKREVIAPFLKRTEELTTQVVPTLQKVQEASDEAARSWKGRLWNAAMWHGMAAGVLIAFGASVVIYIKFHDYYERKTASQIAYAEQVVNYNQEAFKQLAIAQQPIKVLRAEVNGVINQGYALEVPNADSVETRVENGQTNAYVYFSSSLLERQLQEIQKMTAELQKAGQQFGRTNSPR
ncbi:MAG TPA: hypothetical protein VGY56_08675 [Verrucomicrobiae bacterium]|nr:hypothetical protein [Verrucomicrobiae bacterium]